MKKGINVSRLANVFHGLSEFAPKINRMTRPSAQAMQDVDSLLHFTPNKKLIASMKRFDNSYNLYRKPMSRADKFLIGLGAGGAGVSLAGKMLEERLTEKQSSRQGVARMSKRAKEPICDCGKPISQCKCGGHNHKGKSMSKAEKNYYDSNGDSRLMSSAYDQSSPYSQTAYVKPITRARQTAESVLRNPMYGTLQNIGDTEVTRPEGTRVLSVQRTAGKNKENLDQRFRDLLMEGFLSPKRSYGTQARMNIMANPKTTAEYQRLSDAVTFMGNMMGDEQRGYLQGKASPPIKPGPTRGSSTMKRMSKSMDMKMEKPTMPSTKRDVRRSSKYFE